MAVKEELTKNIDEAVELLKEKIKILHLFSDGPEGTLAKLLGALLQVKTLIALQDLREVAHPKTSPIRDSLFGDRTGALVRVRPCGEEYKNKTYLGFYIGDVALSSSVGVDGDKIKVEFAGHNPGIFVPELRKVIYGCESWWGEVEDEKDLTKDITDGDIDNVWYVRLWRAMQEEKSAKGKEPDKVGD